MVYRRKTRIEGESASALYASEERFRALVTASSEVLYRMSPDWSEMEQLVSRGFLANTDEPNRLWLDKYIHPDDQPHVRAAIDEAIRAKSVFQLEHRVKRADGSWGWTLSRAVPVMDAGGEIVEWFGAASDVTERYRQKENLLRANQQKNEFLATLAHELRNPLAAIQTSVELLQRSSEHNASSIYDVLNRQVGHLARLVDDLLDLSRITLNRIELRTTHLPFREALEDAVEMSRPLLEQKHQLLTVTLPQTPVVLVADRARLIQVIGNLLDNASKYTDDGGHISLAAQVDPAESALVFTVRDTGMGIPADVLPHIFGGFVRGPSRDNSTPGMGIGLSVVRQLVELHGGTVGARSEGPGCGSEFVVRLPLSKGDNWPTEQSSVDPVAVLSTHRVLVIDDNRDVADVLGMLLEQIGALVTVVYNGPDGLAAFPIIHPTHVLVDLGMEPMDGYEVVRRIRQRSDYRNVVLVALTGWGTEDDIRRTQAAGFQHHLVKPVTRKALAALLN